jgi:TusA-related sulfurtransferase
MKRLVALWQTWFEPRHKFVVERAIHMVELPEGKMVQVTHIADCMGAACPRPQLITMNTLESMETGDVLELVSDNPTTVETIPALAMSLCSQHLATLHTDVGWRIYIRKGD